MKNLAGYVWKINRVGGAVDEIVSEGDMLLITVKPHGKGRKEYRCEVTSPYGSGRIERTLGECGDWRYESTLFGGKERHLLRGNVELSGHNRKGVKNAKDVSPQGKHLHHIVMIYPDFLQDGYLSGYILDEKDIGAKKNQIPAIIKKKYGKPKSKSKRKLAVHEGTYHSEN